MLNLLQIKTIKKKIKKLICIPGNAGTQKIAENINIDISNFDEIYKIIKKKKLIL